MPKLVPKKVTEEPRDESLPKGRLSYSAVSLYLSCPYAYYLDYVEGAPSLTTAPLLEGSAGHAVLEQNNRNKQKTGDDLPEERLEELWHDEWSQASKTEGAVFDEEQPDEIRRRGARLVRHYRKYMAPKLRPVAQGGIEERFAFKTPGGTPVVGFIDLVAKEESATRVVDYKIAARAKSPNDAKLSAQLALYAYDKRTPAVAFVSLVKGATPEVKKAEAQLSEHDVQRALNVVDSVAAAIRRGAFPYADPSSWKCGVKYCGVWHACPQGGKRTTAEKSFFV